jgi:hypothetical protein
MHGLRSNNIPTAEDNSDTRFPFMDSTLLENFKRAGRGSELQCQYGDVRLVTCSRLAIGLFPPGKAAVTALFFRSHTGM